LNDIPDGSVGMYMKSFANQYVDNLEALQCNQLDIVVYGTTYENDFMSLNGKLDPVIGRWKQLIAVDSLQTVTDCSCNGIYYTFSDNGKVVIEQPSKTLTEAYYYHDVYPYIDDVVDEAPNLVIGDAGYYAQVYGDWLTIQSLVYEQFAWADRPMRVAGPVVAVFYKR
jgi:hypothetical protein